MKDRIFYLFGIIGIVFVSYLIIGGMIKQWSLDRNLEFSTAIATGRFSSMRTSHSFYYNFIVNKKEYQGSGRYYPKSEIISAGDTVDVVYDRTNPDNNETYRDYKKERPFIIPGFISIGLLIWWRYRGK